MTATERDDEHGSPGVTVVFRVRGHVQGVFYRGSARSEALRLGIRGYARNLPDGSVEVLAHGPAAAVDQLADWLATGPPMARVDALDRALADTPPPPGFTTA